MSKKTVITILKFVLAFLLLNWLWQKGKIDFSLFGYWAQNAGKLSIIYLAGLVNFLIVSFRYKLLLEYRSKFKLKWLHIIKSNWIGTFFNSVLPGSVSGDLIKIFYVHDDYPSLSKSFLLASSLIDRVIGLSALILQLSVISILFNDVLPENQTIKNILKFNHALSLLIIGSYIVFILMGKKLICLIEKFAILNKVSKLMGFVYEIRGKLIILVGISFIVQFIGSTIFWALIPPHLISIGLKEALTIIPIGFVSIAIPLAPSGLGVGHMAFEELFKFYQIEGGANFFSLYFVVNLMINLIGVIPYLTHKRSSVKNKNL